jgi:hypothetical protein
MIVKIYNAYTNATETFNGQPEQVRAQLNARYSFLSRYQAQSLHEDLEKLSQQQALFVEASE